VSLSPNVEVANSYKAGDLVEYNGLQCPVECAYSGWYRVYMIHGVVALADAIRGNGALTSLDISENDLFAEGTKLLAKALENNQIMTALSISSNSMTWDGEKHGMSGVAALADVIPGMRALTKLTFGDKQVVTMTTNMTEANFSGKLESYEALIVAAFLPKCT
jgi:hypothetical protein